MIMRVSNHILEENIQKHIDALSKIGNLGPSLEDGFLRASWSDEESAAFAYIADVAKSSGFTSEFDEVGNLFLRFVPSGIDEQTGEILQVGSHLDTVVKGGLFDGGAGIIAGIEALIAVSKSESINKILELVIWRGEEAGTYQIVYKGSKAAFGKLPAEALSSRFANQSLEEAILSQGFSPDKIRQQEPTIAQNKIDRIAAHVELHIEQARKLEKDGDDIGIVTSIRGPKRFRVVVIGQAAHSGATPMGTAYRSDANLAMSYMQVALDKLLHEQCKQGMDLVQTVGIINSDPVFNQQHPQVLEAGITKVCPLSYFSLDIRSNSGRDLESYSQKAVEALQSTAEKFAVRLEIEHLSTSTPLEQMDQNLQNLFSNSCQELGLSSQLLASGAGHDVTVVAEQKKKDGSNIPALLIFIPCRDGISHNPKEFAETTAIWKGAKVIAESFGKLANK